MLAQMVQGFCLGTRLHHPVGRLMDGIRFQMGAFDEEMTPHIDGVHCISDKGEGQGLHAVGIMLSHV
jgi:hypothetical protein